MLPPADVCLQLLPPAQELRIQLFGGSPFTEQGDTARGEQAAVSSVFSYDVVMSMQDGGVKFLVRVCVFSQIKSNLMNSLDTHWCLIQ